MVVKVKLPSWLSDATGSQDSINISGGTVGECLDKINTQFPKIKQHLLNKEGEVRSYILILLNGENIHHGDLTKMVKNGDEISIILITDGG